MKISKSKQELARIISENGGWKDGKFATQNANGDVRGFDCRPTWMPRVGLWRCDGDFYQWFYHEVNVKNYYQIALSHAEYSHLYPAPDADGWIECDGNFPRVSDDSRVDVKDRVGRVDTETACYVDWDHSGGECDIIAYRLHKPTQETETEKLSAEAVSAAKIALMSDSIEDLVRKPTIEQLAADYRNAKDCAERKQKEADDVKADADAKLKELVAYGEAIGLLISPISAKQEPEMAITDWWDLLVGDEVELIKKNGGYAKLGEIGLIANLNGNGCIWVNFPSQNDYLVGFDNIKFIRRP